MIRCVKIASCVPLYINKNSKYIGCVLANTDKNFAVVSLWLLYISSAFENVN